MKRIIFSIILLYSICSNLYAWNFTAGKTVYFDNSKTQWQSVFLRVGRDNSHNNQYNDAFAMVPVSGTAYLYSYQVSSWNDYTAFVIANNRAWTGEHSIFNVNTGDDYAITASIEYQEYDLNDDYTFVPTGEPSLNESENCSYYTVAKTNGLLQHSVTWQPSEGGSINVTYTNVNGSANQVLQSGNQVAHTCIIKVEAIPNENYVLQSLKIGDTSLNSGDTYVVSSDIEISAAFQYIGSSVSLAANPTSLQITTARTETITLTPTVNNAPGGTVAVIEQKTAENTWEEIASPYSPQTAGTYTFRAKIIVDGTTYISEEISVNVTANFLTYTVTVPVGTPDCYICGDMTGWSFQPMNKVDETHYSLDKEGATVAQEYKYTFKNGWLYQEADEYGQRLQSNRSYQTADVVARWAEEDITVRLQAASQPEIWWSGGGVSAPTGDNSNGNRPKMTLIDGTTDWYEYTFENVTNQDGMFITFYVENNASSEYNFIASSCLTYNNNTYAFADCPDIVVTPKLALNIASTAFVNENLSFSASYSGFGETVPTIKYYVRKVSDTDWTLLTTPNFRPSETGTYEFKAEAEYNGETISSATKQVTVTEITYFLKHKFNGTQWTWQEMTAQGDGTYVLIETYNGEGANVNTTNTDTGSQWFPTESINNPDNLSSGSLVEFVYNRIDNTLTIRKPINQYVKLYLPSIVGVNIPMELNSAVTNMDNYTLSYTIIVNGEETNIAADSDNKAVYIPLEEGVTYTFKVTATSVDEPTVVVTDQQEIIINYIPIWIKHDFVDGGEWEWEKMVQYENGIYVYTGRWGNTGADINRTNSGEGARHFDIGNINGATGIEEGATVIFSYDIFTKTLSVVKSDVLNNSYRLKSQIDENVYLYSNRAVNDGDIMSVYSKAGGILTLQKFTVNDMTWTDVTTVTTTAIYSNVIVVPLTLTAEGVPGLGAQDLYTGSYYIRTDGAKGGWNNYKTDTDNKFTYFEPNRNFENETYNHYWVKYLEGNINTKARIANDYNESLAGEKGDYVVNGINVRFSYDNTTNIFERTFLAGSAVNDFLQIYGENVFTVNDENMGVDSKQKFNDISNWVYEYDLKAVRGGTIHIESHYNGIKTELVESAMILGNATTQDTYSMRVIYDFKKNRWIASWLPNLSNMTITGEQVIHVDANMMLVRNHNNKVNSFNITDADSYIDQIQHIYFVMELERDTLFNGDGTKKFSHLFWFSLPYSCKISEIFGIEGYKKKWVIQRYRGDIRAELSWTTNIETFWANMNSTATLEPNRGYVLALNLTKEDFQDIGGKSVLRLYFPSVEDSFKLSQSSSNTEVNVPAHECNVNGRDSVDSHWNVIGIPGFQSVNMKSYSDQSGFDAFAGNEAPNFLYEWKGTHDAYEVVSGTSITYQHFYSYMVQFAGTIDWGQFTQGTSETTPAAVRAQRSPQAYRQNTYRVNLTGEDADDRTFIRLSTDGTEGYVTNQDLEKINNSQLAQIYTLGAGTRLAANTLPRETQAVSVGLNIPANGTYTLSLDENGQSVTAILYDKWENVYTDLSRDSYEFTQMEGRCEGRFEIQFSAEPTVPTDVEEANAAFIRMDGRILRIVGGNDGDNVAVYDMAGRCLLRTQLTADFSFEIPVSGVYVLDIQGKKHKVVIK